MNAFSSEYILLDQLFKKIIGSANPFSKKCFRCLFN